MQTESYKWHSVVRDYELDSQGVVNHAVYVNYLEQARNDYVRSLGIDFSEYYKAGYIFAVTAINVEYHAPLKSQHEFYITAKITEHDHKRITIYQEIRSNKNDKLLVKASIQVACVDYKSGKSCMPDLLKNFLTSLI